MQGMRMGPTVGILLALLTPLVVSGCGEEEPEVPSALASGVDDRFDLVTENEQRYVVGHGVVLKMPADWTTYDDEFEGVDGSTWEWAVGLPEETQALPSGLQFSMGVPERGVQLEEGLADGAREAAELSEGYEFIDEGDADVAGAQGARFLRFSRSLDLGGGSVAVEQVSLFIQVADGVTSTIRFLAPTGEWEAQMQEVYDSVEVSAGEDT